jgi:hypothetical protein
VTIALPKGILGAVEKLAAKRGRRS